MTRRNELRELLEQMPWDSAEREAMGVSVTNMSDEKVEELIAALRDFFDVALPEMLAAREAALGEP